MQNTSQPTSYLLFLSFPSNPAHYTVWHPNTRVGPFSRLCRGEFPSEDAAHAWATEKGVNRETYEVEISS